MKPHKPTLDACEPGTPALVHPRLLSELVRARMCELADQAGLSPRERAVLAELLEGKRLEDIGAALGIGARTVKFHQANVLRKLGVPSRHAILRLLL
jgi:DNA-binding CsgD family transcriptional regulator